MIGTRVTGATRTASAHDRQRPFGTHLLAAGWAYGKSCPWRHSKPQYMQGRISLICDDDSPTNKSRPFGRRRQRNRTEGAKATCEGCGYLEGRQVAPHRDWPALSFRIVRGQVHEHADAPHALDVRHGDFLPCRVVSEPPGRQATTPGLPHPQPAAEH